MQDMEFFFHQNRFKNPIRMPTAIEISEFGDELGVRFPDDYISFIVKYAGHSVIGEVGYPMPESYPDGTVELGFTRLGIFLHFDILRDTLFSVQWVHAIYSEEYDVRYLVPICNHDTYSAVGLDYRASPMHPEVVKMSRDDIFLESRIEPATVPIARSFTEFIDILTTQEEFEAKYGPIE